MVARMKTLRENAGLSQKEVARMLKITQSAYSKYETGNRTIPLKFVIKLALLYGTSIDYLAELTDEFKPNERSH